MGYEHKEQNNLPDKFIFKGDVDQANDASIDQDQAAVGVVQEANVDQELNQAVVQSSEQNTVVSVDDSGNGGGGGDGGDGGDGAAGGGGAGGGNDGVLDLIEAIVGGDLPPGIIAGIVDDLIDLIGDDDGAGGAGGAGGAAGDGGDGGDVNVVTANTNDQVGFNIGANVSLLEQEQEDIEVDQEQEQDAGIGQFNFASLDAFGG